jgi:hypothetical protein
MFGSRPLRSLRSAAHRVAAGALTATALLVPAAPRRAEAAAPAAVEAAGLSNVTFTGFRLLADGRSLVYVELTSKVTVSVEKRGGNVVVYRLEGAYVALKNNKNPLITSGFASILDSARWVVKGRDRKNDRKKKSGRASAGADTAPHVDLVLTLRGAATPTHVMRDGKSGAVLEITLPATAGK